MKVSVIVTNYNYAPYLKDCIQSVLNQTYEDLEIIIVDDGSKDNSQEVINAFDDQRIKKIFQLNGGQASAFNSGFEQVTGDFVAFIDADDIWYINKIERCLDIALKKKAMMVQHNLDFIDENGLELGKLHPNQLIEGFQNTLDSYFQNNQISKYAPTSGLFYAKEVLNKIFPLDPTWKICADVAIVAITPIFGNVYNLKEVLASYRIHGKNEWWGSEEQARSKKNQKKYSDYTNVWLKKYGYPTIDIQKSSLYKRKKSNSLLLKVKIKLKRILNL